MKCLGCGQELIDNKDFCPNCGKRLKKEVGGLNPKTVIIIAVLLILFGVGICLSIMYLGTDKELEPYINGSNKNANIKEFYGNYIVSDVIETDSKNNTPDDALGWSVELTSSRFKAFLGEKNYLLINKPSMKEKDKKDINSLFPTATTLSYVSINGKNQAVDTTKNPDLIIANNTLYLYYKDTLYKLKKSNESYSQNINFYKLDLLEANYIEAINEDINETNNKIKEEIEKSNNKSSVIVVNSKETTNNDIVCLYIERVFAPLLAGGTIKVDSFVYNKTTSKVYNLEDYLTYKNKTLIDVTNTYNAKLEKLKEEYKNVITDGPYELIKDSSYYIENNKLYIKYADGKFGDMFVELEL